jgi:hypothetical protein
VKERLRQLRREVDADREPEELPLLTEEDAGEVLDEAQVEVEGALVVPDGFKVSDPPSEEALIVSKPPSAAAKALEGRRILRCSASGRGSAGAPASSPRPTTTSAARSAATRSTSLLTTRSTARTRTTSRTCSSSTSTGRRTTPSTTRGSCWSRSSHPEEKGSTVRWRPVRQSQKSRRQKRWRWTPHSEPSKGHERTLASGPARSEVRTCIHSQSGCE